MLNQNEFMDTLREVSEIARVSETPLSKEQLMEYFKDMDISKEQEEMIYQYLMKLPQEELQKAEETQSSKENDENQEADVVEQLQDKSEEQKRAEEEFLHLPFVKMYLDDLANIKKLEQAELEQILNDVYAGDKKAGKKLATNYLWLVVEMAKKYVLLDIKMEDVIQEGNMGLLEAVSELCDAEPLADIETYFKEQIQEAMESFIDEALEDENWENAILGRARLLEEAKRALTEKMFHTPTTAELSEFTRLTEAEIEDISALIKEKSKK